MTKSWDSSHQWYDECVGKQGHYYHQSIVLPSSLRLLSSFSSLLDLGCGQGVLARHLPEKIEYVGVDFSSKLIQSAQMLSKKRAFLVADATKPLPIEKKNFERATFILSLQNMENGKDAIQIASDHLSNKGKLLLVLNHPCFRIPRQTDWGIEEGSQIQYRKIKKYMTKEKIPILTNPSQKERSETTFSYHHPLCHIFNWLNQANLFTESLEEWCSDKKSTGKKAKMENRARKEIPLFLAILAKKGG